MVVSRAVVCLVSALLFVTALAGCFGGDDDPSMGAGDDGGPGPGGGGGGNPGGGGGGGGGGSNQDGEGTVSGVVLDDGYQPVHGASVRLNRDGDMVEHTSTPQNGRFEFKDVPAGDYRLEATASCCRDTVERVTVMADDEVTRDLLLQRRSPDEVQRPFVADEPWTGFISCGVNVMQIVQEDPCTADENQDTEYTWNVTSGLRTLYLHIEWEGQTDGVGEELFVEVSAGNYVYGTAEGSSPLVLRVDDEENEDPGRKFENIEGQRELTIEVMPGGDASVGFQQEFFVMIFEFHWRAAPENFEFQMPE